MYSMVTIVSNTILCIWKLLRKLPPEKYFVTMVMDIHYTNCDHFIIYANIDLLCCIPEANIMFMSFKMFFKRREEPSEAHRREMQVLISIYLKLISFMISFYVRQKISLLFKTVESILLIPDSGNIFKQLFAVL